MSGEQRAVRGGRRGWLAGSVLGGSDSLDCLSLVSVPVSGWLLFRPVARSGSPVASNADNADGLIERAAKHKDQRRDQLVGTAEAEAEAE